MKTRYLKTGETVQELDKPMTLKVYTKCPEKWMLVDLETGERYIGYPSEGKHNWKKVDTCRTLT
jgi:hypothetical protein